MIYYSKWGTLEIKRGTIKNCARTLSVYQDCPRKKAGSIIVLVTIFTRHTERKPASHAVIQASPLGKSTAAA